jgi:hypothetical protein
MGSGIVAGIIGSADWDTVTAIPPIFIKPVLGMVSRFEETVYEIVPPLPGPVVVEIVIHDALLKARQNVLVTADTMIDPEPPLAPNLAVVT